jgi:hypothetical protein
MYYTNFQKKEFDSYLECLQLPQTTSLKGAKTVYIDLETLLFSGNLKLNQANHGLLLAVLSLVERETKHIFLL